MNENSSQTIKELSENQEINNSSELDNDAAPHNEEDLSFKKSDIPCLLYTSPSPRDMRRSRMPSSA